MKLTNIQESGAHNILMWAIKNGVKLKEDVAIQSLIDDELSYQVTLEDISFFELYRLTQIYRDNIRVTMMRGAAVPDREYLNATFPGTYTSKDGNVVELGGLVEHACNAFFNIALQMNNDNDIIQENTSSMFIPMIARRFDVQIPFSFVNVLSYMSDEECNALFNENYPNTLQEVLSKDTHGIKTYINLGFVRSTSVIKYQERYGKYLKVINYSPLKSYNGDDMYRIALLGFSKYDTVMCSHSRVTMFKADANEMNASLKRMRQLSSPLNLKVVAELPIQYMMELYNTYKQDVLPITCQSDIEDVMSTGIMMKNFVTPIDGDPNAEKIINGIENYKARISEACTMAVNAIDIIMQQANEHDVDVVAAFSILPPAYRTKAVLTVDTSKADMFTSHSNPSIANMFQEIMKLAESVTDNIQAAK